MSKRLCLSLAVALAAIVSPMLQAQEEPREIRLEKSAFGVEGAFESARGRMELRSEVEADGRVRVEHVLPGNRGSLVLLVDRAAQTAEVIVPKGARITPADRAVFRALSLTLDRRLGDSPEADLLKRATRLWGDHPLREVRMERITAPPEKSWTNLCGITSANLAHDGSGHGLITERLATGPNASNCRSRCGAGCNAILGTSAWTVDCGEHDRCEQHHACCSSCQDEFNSASDDYLFAPNCRLAGW
ncbi:MAG TPA: hypothetical protein VLQ45_20585 [Thermoanaerobaculia bacterium]|nr:hypothetical protein [Thermoanaerobaculia bacterium]